MDTVGELRAALLAFADNIRIRFNSNGIVASVTPPIATNGAANAIVIFTGNSTDLRPGKYGSFGDPNNKP